MTMEIAILTKAGVAMAADSAVTITTPQGHKIYNTANKLFTLSKYRPVGIMVYGSAHLMDVPWETIIKMYRTELQDRSFPTIQEYGSHFLKWLGTNPLFSDDLQRRYLRNTITEFVSLLVSEMELTIEKAIQQAGRVTRSEIRAIVKATIERTWQDWRNEQDLPCVGPQYVRMFFSKYRDFIDKHLDNAIQERFQRLPICKASIKLMRSCIPLLFTKNRFKQSSSGVVIAGFGDQQAFPELVHYTVEVLINDCLKYAQHATRSIDHDGHAIVVPFAQDDVVRLFMDGIDPLYRSQLDALLQRVLIPLPDVFVQSLDRYDAAEKLSLSEKMRATCASLLNGFRQTLDEFSRRSMSGPILRSIGFLPKDQLAELAETLVNLTSVKRRYALDSKETVGGPVDVALISKGDGFIWIKRKHYFRPELNHHFQANYFRI